MSKTVLVVVGFIVLYALFVFKVNVVVPEYSDIVVATTFFFTIFSGFFITRQNDRYSTIEEEISTSDGLFSFLYRISGLLPRIQKEVREIIREHYTKILKTGNWAYHVLNPSTTITKLTNTFASVSAEEIDKPGTEPAYEGIWGAISELQMVRKKIIALYKTRLLFSQWLLVSGLGGLVIVSFDFIPSSSLLIDALKVMFGTSVFIVLVLLKQLDSLTMFGSEFGKKSAQDIFRIIDEKDIQETN
jgi:hypothetical protein